MGQAEDSAAKILQWSESKRTMRVAKEALRLSKGAAHAWECAKRAAPRTRGSVHVGTSSSFSSK